MMFNLLNKEIRLAAHPNLFVFALMGILVIVPAYPYGMVFIFACLGPYITFMYGRETNDIYYSALLPISKRDIVKSKFLLVCLSQMVSLLISLPFTFLRIIILPSGNPAGIEANAAFYGFGFLTFALFNLLFMTEFFKTAYKAGRAFLAAIIPAALVVIAMETMVHFPMFEWMDSTKASDFARQLPFLIIGIILYALGTWTAYKISAKRFEKVDL
ncbi:MAG: ABC-2 transporter permease [Oscillospiraceae bacterium]|jgi:hypothetical protein|nr:ABC-2 transporter permease [Oscillospiraceae bacterium]